VGIGAGFTLAEAVADAWIGDFLPWGSFPDFSDEDYAKVPRHVPDGLAVRGARGTSVSSPIHSQLSYSMTG
jgi:hypothetical protein